MLDWLNFRWEIIGVIRALEKKYYQNNAQLRYNFGSVYIQLKFAHMTEGLDSKT